MLSQSSAAGFEAYRKLDSVSQCFLQPDSLSDAAYRGIQSQLRDGQAREHLHSLIPPPTIATRFLLDTMLFMAKI